MRKLMNKKGQLVTGLINGIGGLIITVVVILVILSTLLGASLLTAGSVENTTAYDMKANFTTGINEVSEKIPTILLIAAVVILFGVIVFLVTASKRMGVGSGGGI